MKKVSFLGAALLLAVGSSALCQDVRYNFDKTKDFSKYHTYKWVEIKDAQKPDELTDNQIKQSIDAQLATKGLTKTDSDTADLYIGYQAAIGTEKQLNSFSTGMGPGWGYGAGWYGGGMGTTPTTTSTIYTGQLDLYMYASSTKDLVWRGVVSKTLDPKAKPDKRQKNLNKATAKLLKNYPPPPAK